MQHLKCVSKLTVLFGSYYYSQYSLIARYFLQHFV